jgi:acetyl esterase
MNGLNAQAQAILDSAAASGLPPVYTVPIDEARSRMRAGFISGEPETITETRDVRIPGPQGGVSARLYHPMPQEELPLVVFFHGGGWTVNDLDTHDRLCALLAKSSSCAVLSVDYRRSPEVKYPGPVEDAYTAFLWAVNNARSLGASGVAVAVAGDSSGGTLAAAVSLLARDRKGPRITFQLLLYPAMDYLEPLTESYVQRGKSYSLNKEFMEWSWQNYLPETWDRNDPYLFPLRADDFRGLPRTLILTAEFDPLRDEGVAYAERLRAAGARVEHIHMEDQMHGFAMQTHVIDEAREAVLEAGEKTRAALAPLHDFVQGN